jgi:vacuolar-type H+-ATPase subunit H
MKETDLLNLIKQSEDEAEAIIKNAQDKISELRKHFEEEKERVSGEYNKRLLDEREIYKNNKLESFNELLRDLDKEKEKKVSELRANALKNFDKVLKEITSSILEQKWQLKR